MRPLLIALALAPMLSGCISLLPEPPPPPRIYTLEAAPPVAASGGVKPVVIAVESPVTARALAGADIAWTTKGQLAFMAGAAWAGRTPDLLQTLLVHTIDRSGGARGALRSGEGRADVDVNWDLTAFGVDEDGALEARLTAQAKLFSARNRTLLATLEVDERAPVQERSARAAAAALQDVARSAAAKISAWAVANAPVDQQADAAGAPARPRPLVGPPSGRATRTP